MQVSEIFDEAAEILGTSNETYVFRKLSDALYLLANKNDYKALTSVINVCACSDGRTLALPREVETPLAVTICDEPALYRSFWYWYSLNGNGSNQYKGSQLTWTDLGFNPTAMDIITGGYVVAVSDSKTDVGRTVRIYGRNRQKQTVRTQDEDGNWQDGLEVPLNVIQDFPSGVIVEDPTRVFTRKLLVNAIDSFSSSSDHDFTSGALVEVVLKAGATPSPLASGDFTYLRSVDSNTISLHSTRSGALTNTDVIEITSVDASTEVTIKDSRTAKAQTLYESTTNNQILDYSVVSFEATTIPTGILADTDYYLRTLSNKQFQIYPTSDDAINLTNRIDVTDVGSGVVANAKQFLDPYTILEFQINHNFLTGDAVVPANSTGILPSPLLAGQTYYAKKVTTKKITLHNSYTDAINNESPIVMLSSGEGASTLVKQIPATALVGTTSNIQAINHNLSDGDFVQFSSDGALPSPISDGVVYVASTPLTSNDFSLEDTSGTDVSITSTGSGQLYLDISRAFTVGFTSQWKTDASKISTGNQVRLDSTITLPTCNPIVGEGTDYYARKIDDATIELYTTQAYALDTSIRALSTISRSSNVATATTPSAHNLTTGDYVDTSNFATSVDGVLATVTVGGGGSSHVDGELATLTNGAGDQATGTITVSAGAITAVTIVSSSGGFTASESLTATGLTGTGETLTVGTVSNGVDQSETSTYNQDRVQITVTGATTFTFASTGLDETTRADTAGLIVISSIKVIAFGSGTLFLVLRRSVSVEVASSVLLFDTDYLKDGATATLTTDGTLPAPLAVSTEYLIDVTEDLGASLKTLAGVAVTLTDIGTGNHTLVISEDMTPDLSTSFNVPNSVYENGNEVTFRTSGTAPSPLVNGTNYYVRYLSSTQIELYQTYSQAINTASTSGRVESLSVGSGTFYLDQTIANIYFTQVDKIYSPSRRDSFVNVYCFDEGRTGTLTHLARMFPDELEPSYRRISLSRCCTTAKVVFQQKVFKIHATTDFIPLDNKQSILLMLRNLMMRGKDFIQLSETHELKAVQYMEEEERAKRGPMNLYIQIEDSPLNQGDQMI